jgi:Fe-S-cluster-containing hydrogenase component 2
VLEPKTRARMVDLARCTGCRLCAAACPWEMMGFDGQLGKATKCWLCAGAPECAAACPTGAIRYVPWRDRSGAIPVRRQGLVALDTARATSCSACHATINKSTDRQTNKLP